MLKKLLGKLPIATKITFITWSFIWTFAAIFGETEDGTKYTFAQWAIVWIFGSIIILTIVQLIVITKKEKESKLHSKVIPPKKQSAIKNNHTIKQTVILEQSHPLQKIEKQFDKIDLLKLQNLILPYPRDCLIYSEDDIIDMAYLKSLEYTKSIEESLQIIKTTVNPDMFFSYYKHLMNQTNRLIELEPYLHFGNSSPSKILEKINNERDDKTIAFLDRYRLIYERKVSEMKTERGKKNQYAAFYASLAPHFDDMSVGIVDFIKSNMNFDLI